MARKRKYWERTEERVNLYLPRETVRLIDKQRAREKAKNRSQWIKKLAEAHEGTAQ